MVAITRATETSEVPAPSHLFKVKGGEEERGLRWCTGERIAKGSPMREVEISREVNEAMDLYHDLYKRKYGVAPVIPNVGETNTIVRDLIRNVGLARTRQLIEQYLKMDGDNGWFSRHGHSLSVMKKNIEAVNAATGSGMKAGGPRQTLTMKIHLSCDKCFVYFDWIGTDEQLDRTRLCPACKGK